MDNKNSLARAFPPAVGLCLQKCWGVLLATLDPRFGGCWVGFRSTYKAVVRPEVRCAVHALYNTAVPPGLVPRSTVAAVNWWEEQITPALELGVRRMLLPRLFPQRQAVLVECFFVVGLLPYRRRLVVAVAVDACSIVVQRPHTRLATHGIRLEGRASER